MAGTSRRLGIVAVVLALLARVAAAETSAEQRIRILEEQLRRTQQQIQELKAMMEQQKAIGQATQKQVQDAAEQAKAASAEVAKKPAVDLADWMKRTTVFGDVRGRHEGFYHQPHVKNADTTARNRERVRARLGARVAFSDELSATIRGASGNINDPISTNETLTGNFNRKNFNLDWAFLTFTPGKSFGMRPGVASITAGKFPNPIFRTDEMFLDEDLSPEGLSETFQLLDKPLGALDQVKVHALQWTFNEIANKEDGWMFGGQVNPTTHIGSVGLEAGLGQYWWLNADQIAQAQSRNTTAFTASGAPVANSNLNTVIAASNQNLLVTQTIQPPTAKGGKRPAAFQAITGYQSGFNQSNFLLAANIPNVVAAQPLRLWIDYVYNWLAATDDAHGWQAGVRLGQTKSKGDWSLWGFYEHLGQEATISAFTASDFGPNGGTNQAGPGVGIDYQLLNPLTISARGYFSNFINRPAGTSNPTLSRFQLDALVKF
jgi:hypothetical protein